MFEKLVEDIGHTAGGSDSAHGKVEGAHIWVRGVVTRLVRKVQLCSYSDSRALEVDVTAECLNEITAISILHLRFNPPREIPECGMCVVIKQYTIFKSVDIVENILNFDVAREQFDVLPKNKLYGTRSTTRLCVARHSTHLIIVDGKSSMCAASSSTKGSSALTDSNAALSLEQSDRTDVPLPVQYPKSYLIRGINIDLLVHETSQPSGVLSCCL